MAKTHHPHRNQSTLLHESLHPITPVLYNHMNEWTKELFNTPEQGVVRPGAESPTIFLSRYGLRTPTAVAQFMMSPAGETVLHEIAQELELEQAIQEQRRMERRDHELMMHRIKAALFLWYLSKKAHASKKLNELIHEQAEKALERLHKASEQSNTSTPKGEQFDQLTAVIKSYEKAIDLAQEQHHNLQDEEQLLQNDLALLMQFAEQLNHKYELYENSLSDEYFAALLHSNGELNVDAFEHAHHELKTQMELLHNEIDHLIEADEDPTESLHKLNALNLKFALMHDMKAISEGKKFSHKAVIDGQEAQFILEHGDELLHLNEQDELTPHAGHSNNVDSNKLYFKRTGHKLVQEHGKVYLLTADQDWETVKHNPAMKEQAHHSAQKSYEHSKQELMAVKFVIRLHKTLENEMHAKRIDATRSLIGANRTEQELVANQIRLLQSAQADVKMTLGQIQTESRTSTATRATATLSLKPTITPTITTTNVPRAKPVPKPAPTHKMQLLEKKLDHFINSPTCTPEKLLEMINRFPGAANQAHARQYIQSLLTNSAKFSFASPELRAQLLQRMSQLGVQTPYKQEKPEPYKSPTPFNTKPNPYKT